MSDPQSSAQAQELQIPEFKSNIPEYILKNIEKEGQESGEHLKYILETLSVLQQQSNWQAEILAKTYAQCKKTNGRVTRLEIGKEKEENDIEEINKELAENREILSDLKGAKSLFSKKWFWGGAFIIGIFISFFVYPYLLASTTYKELITALKLLF